MSANGKDREHLCILHQTSELTDTIWTDIQLLMKNENWIYATQKHRAIARTESSKQRQTKGISSPISSVAPAPPPPLLRNSGASGLPQTSENSLVHTTRKRMIGVQRQLKADGNDYRAFEILNLGKYERQHYIGVNPNLREAEQQRPTGGKRKGVHQPHSARLFPPKRPTVSPPSKVYEPGGWWRSVPSTCR